MTNKVNIDITMSQFNEIITTMRKGGTGFEPNEKVAGVLVVMCMLGLRLRDVLELKLEMIEPIEKRGMQSMYFYQVKMKNIAVLPIVTPTIYEYLKQYAEHNKIKPNELLFPMQERTVQKSLKKVTEYLGYEGVGQRSILRLYESSMRDAVRVLDTERRCIYPGPEKCYDISKKSCWGCKYFA